MINRITAKCFFSGKQIPKEMGSTYLLTANITGGKLLSLFNIVQFKNVDCTASEGTFSGLTGICYSSSDCSSKGGSSSGNCASGFGRCCIIK